MYNSVEKFINFPKMEHRILDFWKEHDCFNKLRAKNKGKPKWSFQDGPITANNPMGVHHAWGRTLKDLYQRYFAMTGHELRYQNGFDCQGLWVEVEVEKELGLKSKTDIEKMGVENFVEKCKERVRKFSAIQTQQSIRLGYWMDWDNSYYTMSEVNNYLIWQFLKKCHDRKLIYKGFDVMPWCIECGSAMSQHEIATEGYRDRVHDSLFVIAKLLDEDAYLMLWTTTPWTLPANTAAAVNPAQDYVKVRWQDKNLYLVKARLTIFGKEKVEVLEELKGEKLLGRKYQGLFDEIPVQNGVEHKVIAWEEVSIEDGTGIVHIAPGCGQEDFMLAKPNNLAVIAPLDEFGNYLSNMGWLSGKNVRAVDTEIFAALKQKGFFWKRDKITHRYPVCWRHGSDLVFRLVDEWFISMDGLRNDIIEVTKKIKWIPEWGLDREIDWLKNMHDWMISKKRFWGLALPIYNCEKCGTFDVIGGKEELKQRAVEGWDKLEGHTPHRPWVDYVKIKCAKCGAPVSRIKDVGNPWLDAGIVPYSTMGYSEDRKYWEQWFPADLVTECFPGQFRNWFYSLLAMSTIMENREPFKVLLGHALVKDEKGNEMHKSTGNAIAFDEAADKIGAEVMRYVFAAQNPVYNLNFGYNMAKDYLKKLLTLWNVYSFYITYAEIDKFNPVNVKVYYKDRSALDRWILSKLQLLIDGAHENYQSYSIYLFVEQLEKFIDNLSNWYLRRSRKRFWGSEMTQDKTSAFLTLYEVLLDLTRLMAPVTPFLSEEIYQNIVRSVNPKAPESVHLCDFPEMNEDYIDEPLEFRIDTVVKYVSLGRSARAQSQLKVRQPLKEIVIKASSEEKGEIEEVLIAHKEELLEELNIKFLRFADSTKDFAKPTAKLNMQEIGAKHGALTGEILKAFNKIAPEALQEKINEVGAVMVNLPTQHVQLVKEDLQFGFESVSPYAVVMEKDAMVAVDTTVSKELELEGIARDFVRHIQTARKEADFDVADRITLAYETDEPVIKEAMTKWKEFVCAETLTLELLESGAEKLAFHRIIEFQDYAVKIGIQRK